MGLGEAFGKFVDRQFSIFTDDDNLLSPAMQPYIEAVDVTVNNLIDEPVATASMVASAAGDDTSQFFNSQLWSEAYSIAQDPRFTAGRGLANLFAEQVDTGDPLRNLALIKEEITSKAEAGFTDNLIFNLASGSIDFAKSWYLDPTVVGGKAISAARTAKVVRPIKVGEDIDKFVGETRTQKYLAWTEGKNGTEIYYGTKALLRSPNGTHIAQALADANKIEDPLVRLDTKRDILKVAYGDVETISAIRAHNEELADRLDNLVNQRNGLVDQIKELGVWKEKNKDNPQLSLDFVDSFNAQRADYQRQLNNLDKELDELEAQLAANERMVGQRVTFEDGQEAILGGFQGAMTERTASVGLRNPLTGTTRADRLLAAAKRDYVPSWARADVYQSSLASKPVKLVNLVRDTLSPVGQLVGGFKQRQPTGVAKLHDPEQTLFEVEAHLRTHAGMSFDERAPLLEEIARAADEGARAAAIEKAERAAVNTIAARVGLSGEVAQEIVNYFFSTRQKLHQGWRDRVYSTATDETGRRIDQIDPLDGVAFRSAVLDTQLINNMRLMPLDEFEKTLQRNRHVIRAWLEDLGGDPKKLVDDYTAELRVVEKKIEELEALGYTERYYRRDLAGAEMRPSAKPHGLYVSVDRPGFVSPFGPKSKALGPEGDVGDTDFFFAGLSPSDPRVLKPSNFKRVLPQRLRAGAEIFGEIEVDSGVSALRALVGEREFERLWKLNKKQLVAEARAEFPDVEWERYQDGYEILMALGGLKARKAGYKGIFTKDSVSSDYDEFVALTDDALGPREHIEELERLRDQRQYLEDAIKEAKTSRPELSETRMQGLADVAIDFANVVNRYWKLGTLLRLGYMVRVLTDDQARLITALGATGYALQAGRGLRNLGTNLRRGTLLADKGVKDRIRLMEELDNLQLGLKAAVTRPQRRSIERRIKSIEKQLKRNKTRLDFIRGDKVRQVNQPVRLPDGQWAPAAAPAGQLGELRLAETSATESFTTLVLDADQAAYVRNIGNPTSWVTVTPDKPHHLDAWLHAINNQIMQSRVASLAIKNGWDREQLATWLRSNEGRQLRKKIGPLAAHPDDYANTVLTHIDHYMPGELRAIAAEKGRVTKADLEIHTVPEARPSVNGPQLDYNLGQGPFAHALNTGVNRIMNWMANTSTDVLSRHPFYATMYRHHARRQAGLRLAQLKRLEGREKLTGAEINEIANTAAALARKDLQRTLFDLSAHSHAGHVLRFVSPFIAAWQEALTKWFNLAKERPENIARLYQIWDSPNRMGLVVDENGNPVPRGSGLSDNQKILLNGLAKIPGVNLLTAGAGFGLTKSSLNIVLQGDPPWMPGFGPIVATPLYPLLKDQPGITEALKVIYPFGLPENITGTFLPSSVRRFMDWQMENSDAFQTVMAVRAFDLMTDWERNGRQGPRPTFEQAKRETFKIMGFRFGMQFLTGYGFRYDSKYQPIVDAYRRLEDEGYKKAAAGEIDNPRDWAFEQFLNEHGKEFVWLAGDRSLNRGGLPATVQAVEATKKYAKTIGEMRDPAFMAKFVIGPEVGEGGFSSAAYRWQKTHTVAPGTSDTWRSVEDAQAALRAQEANIGWTEYDKLMNKLRAAASALGVENFRDVPILDNLRKMKIEQLKAQYPTWREEFTTFSTEKFDQNLEDFRKLASNKKILADNGRTDVRTLARYLEIRDAFSAILKSQGLTANHKAALPILALYSKAIHELADSDTRFSQYMFDRYLARDPMLIENQIEEEG